LVFWFFGFFFLVFDFVFFFLRERAKKFWLCCFLFCFYLIHPSDVVSKEIVLYDQCDKKKKRERKKKEKEGEERAGERGWMDALLQRMQDGEKKTEQPKIYLSEQTANSNGNINKQLTKWGGRERKVGGGRRKKSAEFEGTYLVKEKGEEEGERECRWGRRGMAAGRVSMGRTIFGERRGGEEERRRGGGRDGIQPITSMYFSVSREQTATCRKIYVKYNRPLCT
jgi:hypothetical protein